MTARPVFSKHCARLKSAHGPSHACAGLGVKCAECSYFHGSPVVQDAALYWLISARRGHRMDTA